MTVNPRFRALVVWALALALVHPGGWVTLAGAQGPSVTAYPPEDLSKIPNRSQQCDLQKGDHYAIDLAMWDMVVETGGMDARDWRATNNPDGTVTYRSKRGSKLTGRVEAGCVRIIERVPGTDPPPAPPVAIGAPAPPPLEVLRAQLLAKQKAAYDKLISKAADVTGPRVANGVNIPTAALMLVRDTYIMQLTAARATLKKIQGMDISGKLAVLKQAMPAVQKAKYWTDLRDHFHGAYGSTYFGAVPGWMDYFTQKADEAEAAGNTDLANLIRKLQRLPRGEAEQIIRTQIFTALDSSPVAGLLFNQISGNGSGTIGKYMDDMDAAIAKGLDDMYTQIIKAQIITTTDGLLEFMKPQYVRVWGVAAGSLGNYSKDLIAGLGDSADAYRKVEEDLKSRRDLYLALAVAGLVVITIMVPPVAAGMAASSWITAGTAATVGSVVTLGGSVLSLAGTTVQLVIDGKSYLIVRSDQQNAIQGQAAVGAEAVFQLNQQESQAFWQAIADIGFLVLDAAALRSAINEARAVSALKSGEGIGVARRALSEADAASIVGRAEVTAGNFSDLTSTEFRALAVKNGLQPKATVQIGGRTFHLSAPYKAPDGHLAVLAFEEAADGTTVARSFYLSNEHGIWRTVAGFGKNIISKGTSRFVVLNKRTGQVVRELTAEEAWAFKETPDLVARTQFVNEGSADLATDLQAALFDDVARNPQVTVGSQDGEKLFLGHTEQTYGINPKTFEGGIEQATNTSARAAIEQTLPLTPGKFPIMTPQRTWSFTHDMYGQVEAFVFGSRDGTVNYLVLRGTDKQGIVRVWVPSIQDATAPVGSFGNRLGTPSPKFRDPVTGLDRDWTATPFKHGYEWDGGLKDVPGFDGYVNTEQGYQNSLNRYFANNLPAPGAAASSSAGIPAAGRAGASATGAGRAAANASGGLGLSSAGGLNVLNLPGSSLTANMFGPYVPVTPDVPFLAGRPIGSGAIGAAVQGIVGDAFKTWKARPGEDHSITFYSPDGKVTIRAEIYDGHVTTSILSGANATIPDDAQPATNFSPVSAVPHAGPLLWGLPLGPSYSFDGGKTWMPAVTTPYGTAPGVMSIDEKGNVKVVPLGGGLIYPGILKPNGEIGLYSPGTVVDPAHPPAPEYVGGPFRLPSNGLLNPATGTTTYTGLDFGGPFQPSTSNVDHDFKFGLAHGAGGGNTIGDGPGSMGPTFAFGDKTDFIKDNEPPRTAVDTAPATSVVGTPGFQIRQLSSVPGFTMPDSIPADTRLWSFEVSVTLDLANSLGVAQPESVSFSIDLADLLPQAFGAKMAFAMPIPALRQVQPAPSTSILGRAMRSLLEFFEPPLMAQATRSAEDTTAIHAQIVSLGTATGEAFEVSVINNSSHPIALVGDGIALEAVGRNDQDRARRQFQDAVRARGNRAPAPVVERIDAYCLEYLKPPPVAGTLFRVADAKTQLKHAWMRPILQAEERLEQAGKLVPDSDPTQYVHALRQWAIWTRAMRFTADTFAKEFVAHAKKNFEAAGRPWTRQTEQQVASLVPHRWQEIQMVLAEADKK